MIVGSKITDEERRRLKTAASLRSVLERAISGLEALVVKGIEDGITLGIGDQLKRLDARTGGTSPEALEMARRAAQQTSMAIARERISKDPYQDNIDAAVEALDGELGYRAKLRQVNIRLTKLGLPTIDKYQLIRCRKRIAQKVADC